MTSQFKRGSSKLTFALLGSRLVLFLFFQVLIALYTSSWQISEKYWLLTATLTNLVSIVLLIYLFRLEGRSYLDLFKINKSDFKKDIFIFLGITLLAGPVVFAPGYFLSLLLWNDINVPTRMMFGTIEKGLVYT